MLAELTSRLSLVLIYDASCLPSRLPDSLIPLTHSLSNQEVTRWTLGLLQYLDPGYLGKLGRLVLEEEAGGRFGQREADFGGPGPEFQGSLLRERRWTSMMGRIQAPLGGSCLGEAGLPGGQR